MELKSHLRQIATRRQWAGLVGGLPAPFSDDFARADGAVGNGWTGATWAISSNAAVCTPALGAEMFTNPGAEGVYVGGIAPNWNAKGGGVLTEESSIIHGGSAAQKVAGTSAGDGAYPDAVTLTSGSWYRLYGWARATSSNMLRILRGSAKLSLVSTYLIANGAWVPFAIASPSVGTSDYVAIQQGAAAATTFYCDDISLKLLTLASTFLSRIYPVRDIICSATITAPAGGAGVFVCLDDETNPQNYVLAYFDGYGIRLTKCVAGTTTSLALTYVAYVAGELLEIRRSGTTFQVFYKGSQVGANQTISDATVIGNTKVGLWSCTDDADFGTFSVE